MLVIALITIGLSALAVWAIARVTRVVMDLLGIDLTTALLWFGIAEWADDSTAPAEERPRAPRRRSQRRELVHAGARRRSAAPRPIR